MTRKTLLSLLSLFIILSSYAYAERGSFSISVMPAPPDITATVSFYEPSGNMILDAEEIATLAVTVSNSGRGDAFDVKAALTADKSIRGLHYISNLTFGTIASGKSITKEVALNAAEDLPTGRLKLSVVVKEANGFDADPVSITFDLKAFEPPRLEVSDIGIDDQSRNARVEPREIVEVTARIQNLGYGTAMDVIVDLIFGENVFIAGGSDTRFRLGSIQSGKFKDITFIFYTNKRIGGGEIIPVSLKINEARRRFNITKKLGLVMNAPQRRTRDIMVKGVEERRGEILLSTGLSVDVDINIPEGRKASGDDIAVVIGNRHYSNPNVPDVEYAGRDAGIMREYLIREFGFSPGNIIFEVDATVAKFREIFGDERNFRAKLYNWITPDLSDVFIYYVGHGAPDIKSHEAYFVPSDADPQYIEYNGYRLETFYRNLEMLPAKKITIVLDACFSGNSERGMLLKNVSPAMLKIKKEYRGPHNSLRFASGAPDQVSTWYPEKRHSLFTYYFLKGLQGSADMDSNREITLGEMKEYLQKNVTRKARRLRGIEQHPVVLGDEEEVIVRLMK